MCEVAEFWDLDTAPEDVALEDGTLGEPVRACREGPGGSERGGREGEG